MSSESEWTDDEARLIALLQTASFRFAKTMPRHPHWYTLRKTWESDADFVACVVLIRARGVVRRFKGRPYTQLDLGGLTYWTMGDTLDNTTLINRAEPPA